MNNLILNLGINNLGKNTENLQYLAQGIKSLTNKNMHNLTLSLNNNNLGQYTQNIKYILAQPIK